MARLIANLVIAALLLQAVAASVGSLHAQGLTGQLSGTVADAGGGVMPGAAVVIRNAGTKLTRETVSSADGAFVFPNLLAGTYDLTVTMNGFKTYTQNGISIGATDRVALALIKLELGSVAETVTVQAAPVRVQTQSGERSATITASQIEDVGLRGRDFMGTLQVLPGVVDTRTRDAPGWGSVAGMTINGQSSFNFSYDGVTNKDTGSNSGNYAAPALDSIAEVKVQASNFQAEYGRSSGATITVVTKNGTRRFKGSAAFYKRDERFNANTWERIRDCKAGQARSCSKAPYRFNNTAWTLGGPVLIPGTGFNANRDKLFFFFSQDLLPRTDPGNLTQLTMPTELERRGDFSQTVNSQGQRRFIRDPLLGLPCNVNTGGPGCFPGNVIPQDRLDPVGRTILNLLPLPNTSDPTGARQYNYTFQNVKERPRNDQVLRMDYNIRSGTTFYTRVQFGNEVNDRSQSGFLAAGGNGGWPQFHSSYDIRTVSLVSTLLHSFNATTVLEVTTGMNWAHQSVGAVSQAALDANERRKVLPGLPQFFPTANPLGLIPNMTFAGANALPNMPSFSFEPRFPFNAQNTIWNYSANLTKVKGSHNMKAGVFVENTTRFAPRASNFNGTVNFNGNVQNPFDTNLGWSNALLGSVNAYTESTTHPSGDGRFNQIEFFAQDNWRATRTFTVDYGARFYYLGPTFMKDQQVSYFDPAQFSPARAVVLYEPACPNNAEKCNAASRVARNPLDGQTLNNTFIGKPVPGVGDLYNGMVLTGGSPYKGSFRPAPRLGFAWDVHGDGRMAVRGGAGVFYDRYGDGLILALVEAPPLVETRSTNFTTLPTLLGAPLAASTNPTVSAFNGDFKVPTVYNWSIGVQRELPFHLLADVAYVGNRSRNLSASIPLNGVGYGTTRTDVNPRNADPTNNGQPRAIDYLRPYVGYQNINQQVWRARADYHAMQISLNRRLLNGFAAGVAYTGSRRRSINRFNPFLADVGIDNEARNVSAQGSLPHNLVFNYNYKVPGLSAAISNVVVRALIDGWQISGVSTFRTGTHDGFTYGFTGAPQNDMTGGPGDSRVVLVCDPNLPRGERTLDRQFRTECIRPPGPLTNTGDRYYLGDALGDEYLRPGYMNHDLTLFKNFRLRGGRNFQIRVELYNALNGNQFTQVDTSAIFDFATGNQTDRNFGRVTGTRSGSARVMQLGLRFTF